MFFLTGHRVVSKNDVPNAKMATLAEQLYSKETIKRATERAPDKLHLNEESRSTGSFKIFSGLGFKIGYNNYQIYFFSEK